MLSGSEATGPDVTGAKVFVDDIIALGSKWNETENFTIDDFFRKMFMKTSTQTKSAMDEITWTKKQFVRDRNLTELGIIELSQDINRLEGDVIEARQCLQKLEAQLSTKCIAIAEARAKEETLIRQVADAKNILEERT